MLPLPATQSRDMLQTLYHLEPGDTVRIAVEHEPDLTLETRVSDQGKVELALLGTIHVAGLTAKALERQLREKLLDGYLVNPIVTVTVTKYQRYHVHGEVKQPGGYPLQSDMTIRKAIRMAGGFGPFANRSRVTVTHKKQPHLTAAGTPPTRFINKGVSHPPRPARMDEPVLPGDVINVPMTVARQETGNPTEIAYRLGPGDTIKVTVDNEPSLSLEADVSAMGSINFPLLGEVRVANRTAREVEQTVRDQLLEGFLLHPVVFVTVVKYRVYYMHGEVKKAGGYPFQPGLTIRKAIALAEGFTEFADKQDILVIHDDDPLFRERSVGLDEPVLPGDVINITAGFW